MLVHSQQKKSIVYMVAPLRMRFVSHAVLKVAKDQIIETGSLGSNESAFI